MDGETERKIDIECDVRRMFFKRERWGWGRDTDRQTDRQRQRERDVTLTLTLEDKLKHAHQPAATIVEHAVNLILLYAPRKTRSFLRHGDT